MPKEVTTMELDLEASFGISSPWEQLRLSICISRHYLDISFPSAGRTNNARGRMSKLLNERDQYYKYLCSGICLIRNAQSHQYLSSQSITAQVLQDTMYRSTPAPKSLLGRHRLLAPTASVRVSPICLGGMSETKETPDETWEL